MRLTQQELRMIVREELLEFMRELDERAPLDTDVLDEDGKRTTKQVCNSKGFYSLPHLLKITNKFNQAEKGDLEKE